MVECFGEIGGLLVLFLHVLKLHSRQTTKSNEKTTGRVSTVLLLLLLGGCTYLWKQYQPQMNAKQNTEHCAGAFANTIFGSKSGEL